MASVRCRSRWRVSVAGDPALGGRFPLKTKAQAQAALLTAIGHIGVRCKQESEGTWEVRVRRQGLPELLKSFPTMGVAREWADVREGEIVKREFVNYREANRHTLANVLTTTRSISSRWTRTALIEAASARSARTASAPSACLCSSRPTWQPTATRD